ncbi:MAG TPA: NUDIX hydrolase [Fibrobacteraceae bacterium]|nr:NUDIX hydrolase [Fibrobacteraceae bacterium]
MRMEKTPTESNTLAERSEKKWDVLSSQMLLESPWLSIEAQTCRLPNGLTIEPFYLVHQPDWVLILAQDLDSHWILGRQYRHGLGEWALEFPAGIIDPGETPLQAAKRELLEEAGYGGGHWNYVRSFPVDPDRHTGKFHILQAQSVHFLGTTKQEYSEDIRTCRFTSSELDSLFTQGKIQNPLHWLAWQLCHP